MVKYLVVLVWPLGIAILAGAAYVVAGKEGPAAHIGSVLADALWDSARFGAVAAVGTVVVFGLMCALGLIVVHHGLAIDRPIFHWMSRHQVHAMAALMKRVTKLGNTWTTWGAALAGAACLTVTWRSQKWLPPVVLMSAIVIEHFTTLALRHVFHRLGPPTSPLGTYPSGGCDRVILFYGLIAYLLWREYSGQRRTAIVAGAAVAALGFNEAYSRVYLSLHWFTDALSGLLYGGLLLAAFLIAVHFVAGRRAPTHARGKMAALVALPVAALAVALPVGVGLATAHPTGNAGPTTAPGPLVPRSGAYLGAYVQPTTYTSAGELAAVGSFERQLGGQVNLVHVYHRWTQAFPSAADRSFVDSGKVLLLTWGGAPDTKKIIAGDYDRMIRARAIAVKQLRRPILIEFRHEMDRPNLQWAVHGPRDYIGAWDHIRAIFTSVGALNVGWVWCPTGYGFQVGRAQAFYPGNAEVDWVCADVYSYSPRQSLQQAAAPFLAWAARTGKPVIIGEFAVDGAPTAWPGWLAAAGRFARTHPQIKAIAYFDANGTDSNGRPFSYWLGDHEGAVKEFAALALSRYFRPDIPARQ